MFANKLSTKNTQLSEKFADFTSTSIVATSLVSVHNSKYMRACEQERNERARIECVRASPLTMGRRLADQISDDEARFTAFHTHTNDDDRIS